MVRVTAGEIDMLLSRNELGEDRYLETRTKPYLVIWAVQGRRATRLVAQRVVAGPSRW